MAHRQKLKDDIALLRSIFHDGHERIQVISALSDEMTMRFIKPEGEPIDVIICFLDDYPDQAPVWYSESEDPVVTSLLHSLTTATAPSYILPQIHEMVMALCQHHKVPVPDQLSDISSDVDEEDIQDEADADYVELKDPLKDAGDSDGISPKDRLMLATFNNAQLGNQSRASKTAFSSASIRLSREIKDVFRSENYKNGTYTFELVNDQLLQWYVKLNKVDPESGLASDLRAMVKRKKQGYILFHFIFSNTFPFEPPFVRLVSPKITHGFVMPGGAMCMELLTKQGWTSAYSVESVILQIAATLVKGNARIDWNGKDDYSLSRAHSSFEFVSDMHEQRGWYTPPAEEG